MLFDLCPNHRWWGRRQAALAGFLRASRSGADAWGYKGQTQEFLYVKGKRL